MNVNSNSYTYLFSVVMVVLVAVMLSVAALSLKPAQDANIELEKKQEIQEWITSTSMLLTSMEN